MAGSGDGVGFVDARRTRGEPVLFLEVAADLAEAARATGGGDVEVEIVPVRRAVVGGEVARRDVLGEVVADILTIPGGIGSGL